MPHPPFHECLNAQLRRSMRAVGKAYDAALRPAGIKSTQFTLLAVFAYHPELSVSRLASIMGMDRTTLTRNLQPLLREGWLEIRGNDDGRVRVVRMTTAGSRKLAEAAPLWESVQAKTAELLGPDGREQLAQRLARLETG
ncbi:MarR family winged helix-turn-helix transcriptional regulator [uncultured Roseobacter sp.]|uniref:MarR family winged helix-turn-helix transcriptional regulator n=1 Tax=uncultured Roseobacter sp. TaxID=114847 RepID=UPI00262539D9|nr:MarR family winged helix-turn-helix transcriptional regulator [uncultured Roseobacter sp.]